MTNLIFRVTLLLLVVFPFSSSSANKKHMREIAIAGLVLNTKDMTPLKNALIYDAENTVLGTTDGNGYFKVKIIYAKPGAVKFKLRIVKQGFKTFLQWENWADLSGDMKAIMYFGLQEEKSTIKPFSSLGSSTGSNDLSYENISGNFKQIKEQREFESKLESVKTGNENVLALIDDKYYIVSNTGWIQINTEKDSIIINNHCCPGKS